MAKEIKVGGWYYRMMGYGGSDSQYCCVLRATGGKTADNTYSLFGGVGGAMKKLPVSDIYLALDECGREFEVSANDLADNGHIGIGTLEELEHPHRASIYRDDARLLVETGAYTEDEIAAEFPFAFKTFEEEEDEEAYMGESVPMNEKQAEILRAANAANQEKKRREAEEEARKFAAEVEEARRRFSYIPCPKVDGKWLRTGEVSRNLRAVLKHEFPGVKFKVRSDSFSGGDSAKVTWTEGPAAEKVDKIVDAFQGKRHDCTGDYWDDVATAVTVVCGDFSYTFARREYTPETREYVERYFDEHLPRSGYEGAECRRKEDIDRQTRKLLSKTEFPVDGYEIEGIEWDAEKYEWFMKFKAKEQPTPPTPPDGEKPDNGDAAKGEAYWKENREKRGLEIYFPAVPDSSLRDEMKHAGFRWHKANKCWYAKMGDETLAVARAVVEEFNDQRAAA